MAPDPFSNSEPLEVKASKEGIVPQKPVYDPGKLLDFIKGKGNYVTLADLTVYFGGNNLVAMCALADLDVSGLIQDTGEFRQYPDGRGFLMYKLTKLGQEVDYAWLRPRQNVTVFPLPEHAALVNRVLERDGDLGRELDNILGSLRPEQHKRLENEFAHLRFPTYYDC